MAIFSKRESLTQNITYMGIMAAINVIAVLIITYVLPILFLPFVLIMPLTSTVVTLFCKKRYFIFYAIATVGICFLVSINNISDTLFYVIPSIISGFIFGISIEYKLPGIFAIFLAGLCNTGLTYITLPIIVFMYGQDMIKIVATLFGLADYKYLSYVVSSFILILSIIQATITYLVITLNIKKVGVENEENDYCFIYEIAGLFSTLLMWLDFMLFKEFALFFLVISVFFGVYEVFNHAVKKAKWLLISDGISIIVFVFLFAILYQYVEPPFGMLLVSILFDLFLLIGLVNFCLTKKVKSLE